MQEGPRDIANMHVVAFEVALEEHDSSIRHGSVDEVVNKKIEPHARRHAEHGGQPETDRVTAVENSLLQVHLETAVQGDRTHRRGLRANFASLSDAIAGVGNWHHQALRG